MNTHKSTLHTLNASAREQAALLQRLLRYASAGDSLLLIENGVYNLTDADSLAAIKAAGFTLYCLQTDALARGLINSHNNSITAVDSTVIDATVVDDNGFVELTCNHHKVVSWFV
jgi:tRNA 2-thiouridine synthesizing protein B